MLIWQTELPFSHAGVIKVTNELNEDINYFTYSGESETKGKRERNAQEPREKKRLREGRE